MTSWLEGFCRLSVLIEGMPGARMVGHALIEGIRRGANFVVSTICVGGGQETVSLFEAA